MISRIVTTTITVPVGSDGKNPSAMWEAWVQFLGWEDPVEEGIPQQYSCLENPQGKRSLVGCSPWGCKDQDTTERLSTAQHVSVTQDTRHIPLACLFSSAGPSSSHLFLFSQFLDLSVPFLILSTLAQNSSHINEGAVRFPDLPLGCVQRLLSQKLFCLTSAPRFRNELCCLLKMWKQQPRFVPHACQNSFKG